MAGEAFQPQQRRIKLESRQNSRAQNFPSLTSRGESEIVFLAIFRTRKKFLIREDIDRKL